MKKIILLFLLIIIATDYGFAQQEASGFYWTPETILSWGDYQGQWTPKSVGVLSNTVIVLHYKIKTHEIEASIQSYFDKKNSWAKDEVKTNENLHAELFHFMITEIFTRKLRQSVSEFKFKRKTIDKDLQRMHRQAKYDQDALQTNFDLQTENHSNKAKEDEWEKSLQLKLKGLEEFSSEVVKVKFKE